MNLILTESATRKIQDLIMEENKPGKVHLRVFVQGGGCSGFNYGFTFDETINEDDFTIPVSPAENVLVDAMSAQYLEGASVDWKEDIHGSQFVITNPQAQTTCGCGSSFSV
jgi:iron-sulfur cluster insertion protein